jgi:hypothetical protein
MGVVTSACEQEESMKSFINGKTRDFYVDVYDGVT